MARLLEFIGTFFPRRMKREIKELYLSSVILNFGVAMILLFEPIYLYSLGYSLQWIIFFFLIVYCAYLALMPWGAHFAKHFGYEHSIVVSTLIFVAYYSTLYFIRFDPWLFFIAPLLYALQKTFYWPAYHADFANYADISEDAREVGGIDIAVLLADVAAPFLAGTIVQLFGFGMLFICVSVIFILSNIPLLTTKEIFVPEPFPYHRAYRNLFSRDNRRLLLGYLGYGEELVVLVVWPVFMAIVIKDYFGIGAVVAIAMLITVVITMYIGRTSDLKGKQRVLRLGSIVYAMVWFLRTTVQTIWGVFIVDTLSRLSKEAVSVPLVSLTYERAKQRSIMQTVVFYEMSLVVGKLVALIIIFLLLFVVPPSMIFQTIFILAGCMALLYGRI